MQQVAATQPSFSCPHPAHSHSSPRNEWDEASRHPLAQALSAAAPAVQSKKHCPVRISDRIPPHRQRPFHCAPKPQVVQEHGDHSLPLRAWQPRNGSKKDRKPARWKATPQPVPHLKTPQPGQVRPQAHLPANSDGIPAEQPAYADPRAHAAPASAPSSAAEKGASWCQVCGPEFLFPRQESIQTQLNDKPCS